MHRFLRLVQIAGICMLFAILAVCGEDSPTQPEASVPTRIVVTPSSVTLTAIGQTEQLTAEVFDQNGQPISGVVATWSSSNVSVASVSPQGAVTAVMTGTARITATTASATASIDVVVSQSASRIVVTPSSATLTSIGQTEQLTAEVFDQGGRPIPDADVTWSSSSVSVASVSAQGLITAVMNGTTQITAEADGATANITVTVVEPDPVRDALAALYSATEGINWIEQSNWLSDTPLRDWHGVVLNDDGHIVELHLSDNNLRGSIPPELETLDRLDKLVLHSNVLTGMIPPEIGKLVNLRELDLSHNRLTGGIPPELGQLENLAKLFLNDNADLTGPLPESMLSLTLAIFWAAETQLCLPPVEEFREWETAIPNTREWVECNPDRDVLVTLYNYTNGPNWQNNANWLTPAPVHEWYGVTADSVGNVTELNLSNNELRGPIPPELGQLKNLTRMVLTSNHLWGEIPAELGELSELEAFALFENNLSGVIPPELGQLKNLTWLTISKNEMSGSLPPELGQLESLMLLFLYGNEFSGGIPSEFGQLNNLEVMDLEDNRLTGSIPPELGQLTNLTRLSLADNELTGSIPPELGQLGSLRSMWLDLNELTGDIPPELGQLENLQVLWLFDNQLTGSVPPELGRLSNLLRLSLSVNQLSGTLPTELGNLENLSVLLLRDNTTLSGSLPLSYTNLDLHVLWLSGTQICVPNDGGFGEWLSGIPNRRGVVYCSLETDAIANGNRSNVQSLSNRLEWGSAGANGATIDLDREEMNLRGSIPREDELMFSSH